MALIEDWILAGWAERLKEIAERIERKDKELAENVRALQGEVHREATWRERASANR